MERYGVTRSMSKKGCSPDNSACEGFFGLIKNAMFYGRGWKDVSITAPPHRMIDPYKIGFKENNWYVLGICHLRNDIRVFKMRKMRNVKFTKKAIAKAYEDFEEYEITELDDALYVRSDRIDGPSLIPMVPSYGGYAKVVSPPELIDSLVKHIEILKDFYKR